MFCDRQRKEQKGTEGEGCDAVVLVDVKGAVHYILAGQRQYFQEVQWRSEVESIFGQVLATSVATEQRHCKAETRCYCR